MKKLLELFTKIKSFLFKKKLSEEELLEQENWRDLTQEELEIEEEKTKNLKINYSLFKTLKPYDIVLVKMNEHAIKDKEADKSHFTRPFLITKINDNGSIYGYYMMGQPNTNYSNKKYKGKKVIAYKEKYKFSKNGLIDYTQPDTIFFQNLIHKKGHLSNEDAKKLKKYIAFNEGESVIHNSTNRILEEGDIVYLDCTNYIVYTMDNTKAYMYPIVRTSHIIGTDDFDFNYIENNGKTYYIAYNQNKIIDLRNDEVEIIDKWDIGKVLLIEQNKKNIKLLKRGKIKIR